MVTSGSAAASADALDAEAGHAAFEGSPQADDGSPLTPAGAIAALELAEGGGIKKGGSDSGGADGGHEHTELPEEGDKAKQLKPVSYFALYRWVGQRKAKGCLVFVPACHAAALPVVPTLLPSSQLLVLAHD